MKNMLVLSALAASTLFTTVFTSAAYADGLRGGAELRLLPSGKIKLSAGGESASTDTAFAYGLGAHLDYVLSPNLTIGLAPQFLLNVKGANDSDSANELDLMARIAAGFPANEEMMIFGYLSPGYSIILLPDRSGDNPAGMILDFGAGASFAISSTAYVTGDLGYQIGFQSVSVRGETVNVSTSFVHLGLGVGAKF